MGVCADHVFDVAPGVEARSKSIVLRAITPIGGHGVALHKKPVGVRPRRYPQRLVSVNIILNIATQRRLSAVGVTSVGRAQNAVCDANRQLDILIRECCRRGVAYVLADLQHCLLSPAGVKPLLDLVNSGVATRITRYYRRTGGARDNTYSILNVPVI